MHMYVLLLILALTQSIIGQPRNGIAPAIPAYTPDDAPIIVQDTQLPPPANLFNSVPRFTTGLPKAIRNSSVYIDDEGNVQLNGIIKDGNILAWPTTCGTLGQVLTSDGNCGLVFTTGGGGGGSGNVSTASFFTADNRLIRTDTPSGATNVQQSGITLDDSNNMSGLNTVTANTFIGNLTGTATNAVTATTATNFTGSLSGDVTGTQNATVVSSVGGQSAANVAAATVAANNATSTNTASTIVKRDGSGNFSAGTITANLTGNVTGSASLNVLKAGDSMTGTLNMLTQNEVRFQDAAGGEYVGLHAAATIPSSYTLALPTAIPTANQLMRANSTTPTQLEFYTDGSSVPPTSSETIYVAKYGNDTTGNGSFSAPYASLAKAINTANGIASATNPIVISMLPGRYIENNSSGPLTITATGVSIVGDTSTSTIIIPSTPSNNLVLITAGAQMASVSLAAAAPSTATGISISAGTLSSFRNCRIANFQTGISCTGSGQSYAFNTCLFVNNGTGLSINATQVECTDCVILGASTLSGPAANTGISVTGTNAALIIGGGDCILCSTGISASNNARVSTNSISFRRNNTDINQTTAAFCSALSCNFDITNNSGDIRWQIADAGTLADITSCEFNGNNLAGVPQATCLQVTGGATAFINGGVIRNYITGLVVGTSLDTSSTALTAASTTIQNCTNDIVQNGSTSLNFNAGIASTNKIFINDSTNVHCAFFDLVSNDAFSIGSLSDVDTTLMKVEISQLNRPTIDYKSSLYSTRGIGFENLSSTASTWFVESVDNAALTALTTDRTKTAALSLFSDTASPFGGTTALRGWTVTKNGGTAELAFDFQNNDTVGLGNTPQYTILQLDGTNNQVQLPHAATELVFDADTNLYRSSANVLKTDDNFIVGTLTPDRAVITDSITNQLSSSVTNSTELSYLSGVTSSVQTQLNNKVSRSGDTMTGTLQLPAGTTANPSLVFTGSTTSGLSASSGDLLIDTSGAERMRITSGGTVSIKDAANGFTTAGVVHNNSSGDLSSTFIVNADVSPTAAISDTKLATISTAGKVSNSATTATSANTASTIVARDASGNFSAGTISANLTGSVTGAASLNVLKAGDTMTGALTLPAGSAGSPSLRFSGSTNTGISAPSANLLSFDTNGVQAMHINGTGVSIDGFTSAGVVHNNASGNLSTSLIVDGDITNATISNAKLATISSSDTSGNIVVRDGSGNFATNMITLDGTTTNPTDAATKAYVDSVVSTGLDPKTPAIVVSTTNITLSGTQTIDGVALVANDRVLLVGQTNPVENGLWLVQVGAWTRPADFASGSTAGQAYVLITSGTSYAGSSWLCNTPTAIIDTDPIMFVQFSLPNSTTGANVGAGAGQVFKNKTGNTLNFRTIAAGTHMTVTNNSDDISLATDATATNTVSTLVERDGSGNFAAGTITANLTGDASGNVLKTGDSMTGTLNMLTQNEIRLQDAAGGQYIGLQAPAVIPSSYTLALPSATPAVGQTLRAGSVTPTDLSWITEGGSIPPAISRTVYVATYGDDATGDGSFDKPYASLAKAIDVANGLSSASDPVTIYVGSGTYVEDNSTGPLTITADGIAIVGDSTLSVIVKPSTLSQDLLTANAQVELYKISFVAGGVSTATGVTINAGNSNTASIRIRDFQIGLAYTGITFAHRLDSTLLAFNGTDLYVNDTVLVCNNCTFNGNGTFASTPANTGVVADGSNTTVNIESGTFTTCTIGLQINNNARVALTGTSLAYNNNHIVQDSGAQSTLNACNFMFTQSNTDVSLQVQGAGSYSEILGCSFDGNNFLGMPKGTCLSVSDDAAVYFNGSTINNYVTGIEAGTITDTSSTIVNAASINIQNCTYDIIQNGSSSLDFNAGIADSAKIFINDPTNVALAFFDLDDNNALTIGSLGDVDTTLLQAGITQTNHPSINYKSSLYSTRGIGLENPTSTASTWYVESQDNSAFTALTTDRTKTAALSLFSDTASPFGGTTALRGWTVTKNASTAELAFAYQNSDTNGQSSIPQYTLFQLDGVNNQVQLPDASTKLVFDTDTNLYRSSANVLKTDDNVIVGTLTPDRAVITDSITNQLSSSITNSTELSYLSGVTSSVQTQLNNKVSRSGDTMTGTLQLPAGSTATPSLVFTGSTTTGLSASSGNLSLSTSGAERLKISSGGAISIDSFTTAGVVHNDASGNLSTSLIVNADVDAAAAIVDTKLATISTAGKVANSATTATSANAANTIVARDSSGNFATNMITIAGTVTNPTDVATKAYVDGGAGGIFVLKAGDTMTGALQLPAGAAATPSLRFTGSTTTGLSAPSANTLSLDTNGTERISIGSTGTITVPAFSTAGVLHNNTSGNLSSSLIVNTDVDPAAAIVDTKLATISTAGKVANTATTATSTNTASAIVARDSSGNFSAGTITANLSGNATTATTATNFSGSLSGDVTGTQSATVVSTVGGQSAANVASATTAANAATSTNTVSTIVKRDGSGNFSAGTITASLTGAASLNVLKAGDTMTGALQLPAGSAASPSLRFTGSTTTGISAATTDTLSFDTNGSERMSIGSTGTITIPAFSTAGVVHNNSSGNLSSSLIVNADVDPAAAIVDTKLATISTAGKVANTATTATSTNTASAIVARDSSGNFSAGTITANLSGNATTATTATNFSGSLSGDVTGTQSATVVSTVGGQSAANVASATTAANAATSTNTASTIVKRDGSGNFSAGTITASLTGAASLNVLKAGDTMTGTLTHPAGSAAAPSIQFTGSTNTGFSAATANTLSFDVSGTEEMSISSTSINMLEKVVLSTLLCNQSIQAVTPSNGGTVTISSTTSTLFLNPLSTVNITVVFPASPTNGQYLTITNISGSTTINITYNGNGATVNNGVPTMDGNTVSATYIYYSISNQWYRIDNYFGTLSGDVTGTQSATVVSTVGGQSAANVASATTAANAATSTNTASTIVKRDGSGNFSAGTITASLTGAASLNVLKAGDTMTGTLTHPAGSAATPSIQFTGSTNTGFSAATANTLSFDTNGSERMSIGSTGTITIPAFSTAGIVHNNSSGNLSSSLIVNADVDPAAAIVDTKLATISTAGKVANTATTATSTNTASTIVARDSSGNFSAGTITLSSAAAGAPSLQFSGSTNTGLSAASTNTISFDTNGTERMNISTTAINAVATLAVANAFCLQGFQSASAGGSSFSVTVNNTTSVLLLKPSNAAPTITVTFPSSPTNGQILIMVNATSKNITLVNTVTPNTIVNPITTLNTGAAAFTNTVAMGAVAYVFNSTDAAWYRIGVA